MLKFNGKDLSKFLITCSVLLLAYGAITYSSSNFLAANEIGFTVFLTLFLTVCALAIAFIKRPFQYDSRFEPGSTNIIAWKFIILHTVSFCLFIVVAFHSFLFGNGVIGYFSPSKNLVLNQVLYPFSLTSGYSAGNQRIFIQQFSFFWPFLAPLGFVQAEKLSLISQFGLYYFLSVIVAKKIYTVSHKPLLDFYSFSILFVYIVLLNTTYMQEAYGSFIIGSLMIIYILAEFLSAFKSGRFTFQASLRVATALIFACFGDPRFFIYFLLIVIPILFLFLAKRRKGEFPAMAAVTITLSLPFVALIYILLQFTSLTSLYTAGRAGDLSTISFFSTNSGAMNLWNSLGDWWSAVTFAPPSILSLPRESLSQIAVYGNRPFLLLPGGGLQWVWLLSLSYLAFLSLIEIYFVIEGKGDHQLLLFLPSFLLVFLLALGSNVHSNFILSLEIALTRIPWVGNLWAITISTPQYFNGIVTAFMIFFSSFCILVFPKYIKMGISAVESRFHAYPSFSTFLRKLRHRVSVERAFSIIMALIIIFVGWQFLFQSNLYGPYDYSNPSLKGNNISPIGNQFYPVNPPSSWLTSYEGLAGSQNYSYTVYSNVPGSYEMWLPSLVQYSNPGVPANPEFSKILSSLMTYRLSYLVPTLFSEFGVKYVFIDNTSSSSAMQLYDFLSGCPGLTRQVSSRDVTVFEYDGAKAIIPATTAVGYSSGIGMVDLLFSAAITSSLDMPIAFVPVNKSSLFNLQEYSNDTVYSSITPVYYMNASSAALSISPSYFDGIPNMLTSFQVPAGNTAYLSNWSILDASPVSTSLNVIVDNGTTKLTAVNSSGSVDNGSFLMAYLNPLFPGVVDLPIQSYNSSSVVVRYSFSYYTTSQVGTLEAAVLTNDYGLRNNFSVHDPLNLTHHWTNVSKTVVVPAGARTFTFQISDVNFKGSFFLSNLSVAYGYLQNNFAVVPNVTFANLSVPRAEYSLFEYGSSSNSTMPQVSKLNLTSILSNHSLSIQLPLPYVSFLLFLPASMTGHQLDIGLGNISYNKIDSQLKVNSQENASFLIVSYDSSYHWSPSSNLEFLASNSFGQQIFAIKSGASVTLTISHATLLFWVGVSMVIVMNVLLPLLNLFFSQITTTLKRALAGIRIRRH